MKYIKSIMLIMVVGFSATSPVYNPRLIAFLFKPSPAKEGADQRGSIDPQIKLDIFSGGNSTEDTINKFSNYLIPSKEEVLQEILKEKVPHAKAIAYGFQALFKAYCLCPGKDDYGRVKFEDYKNHAFQTGQTAGYNYAKQCVVEYTRKQIDPYLKSLTKKIEVLNYIENRKIMAALGYVAHRSINRAIDLGCDATCNLIKSQIFRK